MGKYLARGPGVRTERHDREPNIFLSSHEISRIFCTFHGHDKADNYKKLMVISW